MIRRPTDPSNAAALLGAGLALAVGASALLAPAADAAKKRPHRHPVLAVTPRTQGVGTAPVTVDATCPRGTRAIGGGFSTFAVLASGEGVPGGGTAPALEPTILESRRLDPRSWRVTETGVRNPAISVPIPGTSNGMSVFCQRGRPVSEVSATGPNSSSATSPSTATALCPKGRTAIAGGFSIQESRGQGFVFPSIYASFRSGKREWTSAAAPGNQSSVQITSYAYCAHRRKPPLTRSGLVQAHKGPGFKCPRGLAAGAGGFASGPGTNVTASIGTPAGKKVGFSFERPYPAGRFWYVATDNSASPTSGFVYCS